VTVNSGVDGAGAGASAAFAADQIGTKCPIPHAKYPIPHAKCTILHAKQDILLVSAKVCGTHRGIDREGEQRCGWRGRWRIGSGGCLTVAGQEQRQQRQSSPQPHRADEVAPAAAAPCSADAPQRGARLRLLSESSLQLTHRKSTTGLYQRLLWRASKGAVRRVEGRG
jgi:hypothetical protein